MKSFRCDDCGRFAKLDDLNDREPHLGGLRHRGGKGCWTLPKTEREQEDPAQTEMELDK